MDFNPNNPIVKRCLQGMDLEAKNRTEEAYNIFMLVWEDANNDFEKFMSAHYLSRLQKRTADKLKWLETALLHALNLKNSYATGIFPGLYANIARCYEESGDWDHSKKYFELAKSCKTELLDSGPFYHGTKADLQVNDLLTAGFHSNYKPEIKMNHIYFSAGVSGAGLAAEIAKGEGDPRVYMVEPTGPFENDPNVTDQKFPGNPTRSYRSTSPLKIVSELSEWPRMPPEELRKWQERVASINANPKAKLIN